MTSRGPTASAWGSREPGRGVLEHSTPYGASRSSGPWSRNSSFSSASIRSRRPGHHRPGALPARATTARASATRLSTWRPADMGILDPLPLAPEIDRSALIGFPASRSLFDDGHSPSTIYLRADPEHVEEVRRAAPGGSGQPSLRRPRRSSGSQVGVHRALPRPRRRRTRRVGLHRLRDEPLPRDRAVLTLVRASRQPGSMKMHSPGQSSAAAMTSPARRSGT